MKNLMLLSLLFVGLTTSCGKKVAEVDPNYLGYWENVDGEGYQSLNITNGSSLYEKYSGATETFSEGKAKIKGNERKLKIGLKGFKIDQTPTKVEEIVNGEKIVYYTMILDGITFTTE